MTNNNEVKPPSITMVIDLSVATKADSTIPLNICTQFPEIVESLKECRSFKSRFFGFVIVPGKEPSSFCAFAKGIDTVGMLIHGLCEYSKTFGDQSKWILVSEKKTQKQILPIIDRIAKQTSLTVKY
jgi:hypothetical protein